MELQAPYSTTASPKGAEARLTQEKGVYDDGRRYATSKDVCRQWLKVANKAAGANCECVCRVRPSVATSCDMRELTGFLSNVRVRQRKIQL